MIAGHVWLVVANDPDKTWHEMAPHVLYQINLYAKWMGDSGQDFFPHMNSVEELRKSGLLNVATPERAVELIRDYASRIPIERYYTWTCPPGLSAEKDVRAPGVVREQGDAAFSRMTQSKQRGAFAGGVPGWRSRVVRVVRSARSV